MLIEKLFAWIRGKSAEEEANLEWVDGFDHEFYYQNYRDLRHFKSAKALRKHYLLHGFREGRWKNVTEAKRSLEARFGNLPEDFNADTYKDLNQDLASIFDHEWQFALHFLEHGCKEGRRYSNEDTPRRAKLLTIGTSPSVQKGLEFGALDKPVVRPENGDIRFVDYTTREGLRAHPHADTIDKDQIVHVDYVWSGTGSLADVINTGELFDYAIASHVIEHVPNIIGWLKGIYDVLKPGGILNLAIPDKRFTFDVRRNLSTVGDLVEAYLLSFTHPSVRQMFDHCYEAVAADPGARWIDNLNIDDIPRYVGDIALQLAYDQAVTVATSNRYFDSHCLIVTPASFLTLIEELSLLHLFPFVLGEFHTTVVGELEFFCHFVKPAATDELDLLEQQLSALEIHKQKFISAAGSRNRFTASPSASREGQ